jgi:hypothetical protein
MRGLLVEYFFAGFGRTDHVPVIPAKSDLVELAIFARPGCDLLVGLKTKLVGVAENRETCWTRCMMDTWRRTFLVAVVDYDGGNEAEE